jgi:hypothetical protein
MLKNLNVASIKIAFQHFLGGNGEIHTIPQLGELGTSLDIIHAEVL